MPTKKVAKKAVKKAATKTVKRVTRKKQSKICLPCKGTGLLDKFTLCEPCSGSGKA